MSLACPIIPNKLYDHPFQISRRAETLPTCPDCHTFILELQQFSDVCIQTHSIYSELRKKCQPERYRADLEDQVAQEMEQRQLIEEQEAQEKADQEETEHEEQIHIEEIVVRRIWLILRLNVN